jgi:aspartate aminotransferase/aminotransferase
MFKSKKVLAIGPASSVELNETVYRLQKEQRNPIVLSYGEAPFTFSDLSLADTDFNNGAHYSDSRGVDAFREKLRSYYSTEYLAELSIDHFMVTAGSKIGSYIALQTILDDGDAILLHEPSWVSYQEHAKLCGATASFIPITTGIQGFVKHFESNVKALVLNNPNNPRGTLYTKEDIRYCAQLCKDHGAYLIVDESYSDFVGFGKFFSVASLIKEFDNVIALNSVSKNFGLSGWRVGYLIANVDFLRDALKLNQHLITCAPTILQNYLAANFEELLRCTRSQVSALMEKRLAVQDMLEKLGINYLSGGSTFYFFLDLTEYNIEAKSFCLDLLETENVAIIPGNAYGNNLKHFVRLSFGVEPLERIEEGLKRLIKKLGQT